MAAPEIPLGAGSGGAAELKKLETAVRAALQRSRRAGLGRFTREDPRRAAPGTPSARGARTSDDSTRAR
jgi:hypothetical protein